MTITQALHYIHTTPKFNRLLGNDTLRELLSKLDNPHMKNRFIHLAGTNGKGSTASMISSILKTQGYRVGLFTSPFIEKFNERIQINGIPISDNDLITYVQEVKSHVDTMQQGPSEFALITAIAFLYFKRQNCDFVILETGMGGRLDATNVIEKSMVSVITSISLDHTEYLGDTIEKITTEKCGIIKKDGYVISYPLQQPQALSIIENCCKTQNAHLTVAKNPQIINNHQFSYQDVVYSLSLLGDYQPYNAVVSLEVIFALQKQGVTIDDENIKLGLKAATWIGRFEKIAQNPTIILDGAHNIDGILHTKQSLLALNRRIILIMAMMHDKDYQACVQEIAPISDVLITTELPMPRCVSSTDLAKSANGLSPNIIATTSPTLALIEAKKRLEKQDVLCICGSLYLVGELRKQIKNIERNEI